MKTILKRIAMVSVIAFLAVQLIRPDKNTGPENLGHIEQGYTPGPEVKTILKTACYDCHSNTTQYPWYAEVQPLGWWLNHHIEEGKEHLNFSVFMNETPAEQIHKLEEIEEVLAEGEMPMTSYTLVHREARLNPEQKALLTGWCRSLRDSLNAEPGSHAGELQEYPEE